MNVVFAIPSITGSIESKCFLSIFAAQKLLIDAGIGYDLIVISGCPYLPTARNTLAAMFLKDPDATDLFFIDADVGFAPQAVPELLKRDQEIVAGIYPLKQDTPGWPVELKGDGPWITKNGLIEADFLPTGFIRIKREVFGIMADAYPDLKYAKNVAKILDADVEEAFDFFNMGVDGDSQRYTTEDFAFCKRWRKTGGRLWVYPDIHFEHVGRSSYRGNYQSFLLSQPKGADSKPYDLRKAKHIKGWLTIPEMQWLSREASRRELVVELGCAWGRSTRAMIDNMPEGSVLYAVDHWKGPKEDVYMTAHERDNLFKNFSRNLGDHISSGKLVPIKVDHDDLEKIDIPGADMVFIDGDHCAKSVMRDIEFAISKLNPGGLICGHDSGLFEVDIAVNEKLKDVKKIPGTSLWAWSKP